MADNTPNTEEQIKQSAQWKKELGGIYDTTVDIHTTLLEQVNALKNVREESKNVYSLQEELNKLIKKGVELNNKKADLESDLAQNAQNELDIIQKGFEARRNQGELIGKLVNQVQTINELTELQNNLQATGGQLNQDQQNRLNAALQKKASLDYQIAATQAEELRLSRLLEAGAIEQLNHLSDAEKAQLRKYINVVKENEEYETYLKNHDINLKAQMDLIEAQKAQMSNWQKLNQYLDHNIEKAKKIKVVSDSWEWGKKQFDSIMGGGIQGLLNMVLEYGKTLTDAAKQLGISVDGVRALADGYEDTAMRAKEINSSANAAFLTNKNQLLAQQELNAALGTSGLVTEQARVDQIVLTKQMGLQADEAAKLYQLGLLNGKSADQVAKITAQRVIDLKKETGIQLNLKGVLQDVAKVSGQLAAQYNNNPEALAKAVVQAKALGVTLEQTAGMADKLLDFPTSIQNELEAELLTGKQLNLEQARYFALMGDSAAAAKELMNNVGGIAEFQQLNVLQQRSLAQAIGMSADELSNALKQQELFKGSAFASQQAFEEAVRTAETEEEKAELLAQIKQSDNAEQLMQQYQQISAQEKFNQAVEKLKEMVASFVDGPFGSFLEGLSNAVSSAETLKGIMYAIGTIMVGNMLRGIASFGFQMAAAIIPTNAVAAASIATASAITLGIGIAAIIAGLAAGASALSSATGKSVNVNTATGGVTGGINVPNSGANNDRNINITLKNENTTYVAGQKISHLNTESQKLINSRNA